MNYLISIRKNIASLNIIMILTGLLFTGINGVAQNINIPNKIGTMGLEVNSYTGNLYFERTDFVIPGKGVELAVRFSYNSYDFDVNRGFGNGWGFEFSVRYYFDSSNNFVVLWGDGREDTYETLGNGSYQAPLGFFSTLKEYEPGKFSITEKNGLKYLFENSTNKRLTKIQGRNNQFININLTDTLITSLVNNYGQTISFAYDTKGRLISVTDAIAAPSRTWTYAYDAKGNLTEVTDPLGAKDSYTYMINGPMKTVSDKNLNVVDLIYYNDYSLHEMIGCNKRMSFSYDTTQKMTVVTDHLENGQNLVNKYFYKAIGNISWLSAISSNCCGFDVTIEYDEAGNKIKQTDANGNVTRYTYDGNGNMLSRTNALGGTTTFTYTTGLNLLSAVKDPKGFVTNIEYDLNGNINKITEPNGSEYSATYDAAGNMLTSTNPKGQVFSYTYDALGNLNSISGPEGFAMTMDVSARGDLLSYTDPKNQTQSFQYDILGRMVQLTDPLNNKINFSYDPNGNLFLIKNKNNEQSRLGYDASDRIRTIEGPLESRRVIGYDGLNNIISNTNAIGATSSFVFNDRNLMSKMIDPLGNETTFSYDRNGNVITHNLPSGQVITYTYDALDRIKEVGDNNGVLGQLEYDWNGNIARYVDASGATNTFEYDNMNRTKKITDALGNTVLLGYDATGKVNSVQDKNGKTMTATYDNLDRLVSMTDYNGATTQIGYDAAGNITSLTDANNNTTTYTYDALNRMKRATYPDGKYTENTYDVKGNVLSFRNKDGGVIQFTYDSLNRVVSKTLPGGQVFSYTYDKAGRITSATNSSGTVQFTYDLLNRITSETFNGTVVNYAYDILGRTQTTIYPDLTEIKKTYDTRNRLVSVQKNNQPVVSYQYNNANQVTSKTFDNGLVTTMQYDFAGRLTNLTTGSIQNLTFTYDNNGNRTSIIRGTSNLSEFFTYDDGNRLLTYKRGVSGGPFTINNSYTYDALGNRNSAIIGGKNFSYTTNSLNQMLSSNDGTTTTNFIYDDNGNLVFDGKYHKTYDGNKKLLSDSASPSEVVRYQYDALGRMIGKTVNGVQSFFTYAGMNAILEKDISNITKNRTIYNSFLEPVVNEHYEVPFYYHQNHLYSVEMLTNGSGNLAEQYRYDAYGEQSIFDASGNPLPGSITGNRYGFTGQVFDSSTGHNQFYFRNYNPETGLFNQQDLIGYGDGMGMYQYVGNNPANGIDVFGLEKDPCAGKERKKTEVLSLQYLDKVLNYLNMVNATLKKTTGSDLNDRSKKLKLLSTISSVTSLANKINNLRNNWDQMSTKDANVEIAEIELALAGLSNDLGVTGKIPYVGKELEGILSAVGTLDAFVQETTGKSMAYHYAHMSDNAEKFGQTVVKKNQERAEWLEKYLDAVIKTQGEDVEDWTEEAKEWLEVYLRVEKFKKEHTIQNPKDDCPQDPNKPKGKRKRKYHFDEGKNRFVEIIRSNDPNEIIGPEGQPDKRWVSVKDRLPYTVTFENDINASAPAKYVKVIVPVHEKMDAGSFQLSNFGFNNQTFTVPATTASSYQRLDARDSLGMFIDLVAGFDVTKNEFFWEFQAIDPVTMMPTTDPMKGFLLLQDTTEEKTLNGHGFVNFSIKPVATAQTLDSILAYADIVFDQNDTIPTNIEKNVIDAVAPTSQLSQLDPTYSNFIPLSWSGQDDPNGCGVHYYTLYFSTDGTNFNMLKDRITRTDTTFTGLPNTTYFFFVLATDSVGNVEQMKPGAIQTTYLGSVLPVTWLYFKGTNKDKDNLLEWATTNERNSIEFKIERSFDAQNFSVIGTVSASGNTTGNSSYHYTDYHIDRLGEAMMYYRLVQIDKDGRSSLSNVVRINYDIKQLSKTIVYPNPTKGMITVVVGDATLMGTVATVYDEAGKLLQSVKISSLQQKFDLGNYTNGIYFIRLANKEVLKVMKH